MKKFALLAGSCAVLALLGAGCTNDESASETPVPATNANTSAASETPTNANTPPSVSELKPLPALKPLATPIVDTDWATMTTKTSLTLRTPTKGTTAPTTWSYALIDNHDPHLQDDCYIADGVVYKDTTSFSDFAHACQTATELAAGPGERTDYFVFQTEWSDGKGKPLTRTHLITMNKKYKAGFDMNAYSAVVQHIIQIID